MNEVLNHTDMYSTMSIASFGSSTLPKMDKTRFVVKRTNDVSDIDGAQSGHKHKLYFNKPLPQQSDIPGSTSKPLTRSRNTRDNSLYIDDIEGTRHTIKDRMMRTNRHVNPLDPHYQLPSYTASEYPIPKFIRDPLTQGIVGEKSQRQFETRDIISVHDIEGAQANWKPRHRRVRLEGEPHDIMATADVSARKTLAEKTSRMTNVMDPHYTVNGMDIKDGKETKPTQPKPYIPESALLMTHDIDGAVPGWRASRLTRREYRNTNFLGDVEGACADSIKKGIVTKRETNPLTPVYQSLDPEELLLPLIPPLLPKEFIKVPTFRPGMSSKTNTKDLEPIAVTSEGAVRTHKPSSNQDLNLDLSKTMSSTMHGSSSGRMMDTVARTSSGRALPSDSIVAPQQTQVYSGRSPALSNRLTPKQRQEAKDMESDINAVRELR